MDYDKLKKDLFYRNEEFSFIKCCCLCCVVLFILFIISAAITPDSDVNDTNVNDQLSAYDRIPYEFKNTEDYQIVDFENSICAVSSKYDLVLNDTHEKNFTYSLDGGNNPNGVILSIKELDDNSSDINPNGLKEPNYRYVESENLNVANTPIKKVEFTDTHGGEPTNENWVDYTIYTFDKNGKHYQITSHSTWGLMDFELEEIIKSFTKK